MKLNDTQLLLLSRGAQRDDLLIDPPHTMPVKTLQSMAVRLIRLGLAEEIWVRNDQPSLWTDQEARPRGLRITRVGLQALGLDSEEERQAPDACSGETASPVSTTARTGTKRSMVIGMLQEEHGATLLALTAATGWLPHTTRAALTGLRKAGHFVIRSVGEDGASTYRILLGDSDVAVSDDVPGCEEAR